MVLFDTADLSKMLQSLVPENCLLHSLNCTKAQFTEVESSQLTELGRS